MKTVSKALLGTIAAGAMVASSAAPALADHRNDNGISAGEIIAGALIIGGIAAVVSASNGNNRGYDDGNYGYNNGNYGSNYGNSYGRNSGYGGNPRQAVEQCINAAERYASSRGIRANVTDIREVKDTRYGYQVRGNISVQGGGNRGWQSGGYNNSYGQNYGNQGWNNRGYENRGYDNRGYDNRGYDNRGYNDRNYNDRGYDTGSFKCKFERGQIADLDFGGIDGL